MATKTKTRAVLVCTEFRAVVYGQTTDPLDATTVTLTGFRNCLWWDTSTSGVFGLAEKGPDSKCRIGAKVTGPGVFQKVTFMASVTPEAAKAWEDAKAVT